MMESPSLSFLSTCLTCPGDMKWTHVLPVQVTYSRHVSCLYRWYGETPVLPVGVVEVSLLVDALTPPPAAGEGEVACGESEGAGVVGGQGRARGLVRAGVVQVGDLQLPVHQDELPGPEVQQGDRAQRGAGQEVEQPNQTHTDLRHTQTDTRTQTHTHRHTQTHTHTGTHRQTHTQIQM